MTNETPLDAAHAAMLSAPDDDAARLGFFERLADCELFLMLTDEAQGARISPEVFDVADGRFALAFDREDRLADFAGRTAAHAAMSGRVLARLLAEQGIGLGLNLDVAPSSYLVPADALDWLTGLLDRAPDQVEAQIAEILPPRGLPEPVLRKLDAKLSTAAGLAQAAYLAGVVRGDGGRGYLLAVIDAVDGAQGALANAVAEALTFSGLETGELDVAFFAASDPVTAKLAATGLRFDLPKTEPPAAPRAAPGSDPEAPPILMRAKPT